MTTTFRCPPYSAIQVAAYFGKLDMLKFLHSHGAELNPRIMQAAMCGRQVDICSRRVHRCGGHLEIVRWLVAQRCEPTFDHFALAVKIDAVSIAKFLMESGVPRDLPELQQMVTGDQGKRSADMRQFLSELCVKWGLVELLIALPGR